MFSFLFDLASELFSQSTGTINAYLNKNLEEYNPATIVWVSLGSLLCIQQIAKAYQKYKHNDIDALKAEVVNYAVLKTLKLPYIGKKIDLYLHKAVHKTFEPFKKDLQAFDKTIENLPKRLPQSGYLPEDILSLFQVLPNNKTDYKKSGAVYMHIDLALKKLLEQVSSLTYYTNPMHDHWIFLNRLQGRIIELLNDLLQGEEGNYGLITHGGTTSILEACKSYVLYARQVLLIDDPEILVPHSAHPAFDKAAKILHAKLRIAPVNLKTGQVDVVAMEKLINSNTVMLVGSAPSYPYGIFDDIPQIARLGLKYKIPVHVDACLGGFLNVFAKKAGISLPSWDFSIPGVTSISADLHKYGYSPKGISLVFFHASCKALPTYTNLNSACGMYVTEGIDGSRSGQPIAEAYSILMYYGESRYVEEARKIFLTQKNLVEALARVEGVQLRYKPQHAVIGIQGKEGTKLALVAEQFQQLGWSINALPLSSGMAFHFCITAVHANEPTFISSFVNDLAAAVAYAQKHPKQKASGMLKAYGQISTQLAPNYVKNLIGDFFSKTRTMSIVEEKEQDENKKINRTLPYN